MQPFRIDTHEIFAACKKAADHGFIAYSDLMKIVDGLFYVARNDSVLVEHYIAQISLLLSGNVESWLHRVVAGLPADERYRMGAIVASTYIYCREYEKSLASWNLALSNERPVLDDMPIAISVAQAEDYDSNPLHCDLAMRLALFAGNEFARDWPNRKADVLDLCCGTGLNADYLRGLAGSMTGIDLEVGGVRQSSRDVDYRQLITGDVTQEIEKLDPSQYDVILMTGAAYHFSDLAWLFKGAARLLREDGALVFNSWPCIDEHDWRISCGGTFRYCHSERYLQSLAHLHGLRLAAKSWHVVYNTQPNWFLKFFRMPIEPTA